MLFVVHVGEYAIHYSAVHFAEISQHVNLLAHFMDVRKGLINSLNKVFHANLHDRLLNLKHRSNNFKLRGCLFCS